MVMRSGTMDLRKFAELNGEGSLAPARIREYASEMASVMRWVGWWVWGIGDVIENASQGFAILSK